MPHFPKDQYAVDIKIIRGIISYVLLLCGTAYGLPQAVSPYPEKLPTPGNKGNTLGTSNPSINSSILIESKEAGITLQIKNSFLIDVLQEVANQTDIRFDVASQIKSEKVNIHIIVQDWDSGIDSLTKGFSRITVWGGRSEIKEVLLLGKNNWNPQEDSVTSTFDNLETAHRETDEGKKDSTLSISKLKRLIQIPPGKPFPSNLFQDREIRRYLELKGIRFPGEWKRPNKARAVLHMAKKELSRLLFEKQTRSKVN